MEKITQENFNQKYLDRIEVRQIDHFVCKEMGRQIHRYIKGMSGRKCIMEKFEESSATSFNFQIPYRSSSGKIAFKSGSFNFFIEI